MHIIYFLNRKCATLQLVNLSKSSTFQKFMYEDVKNISNKEIYHPGTLRLVRNCVIYTFFFKFVMYFHQSF